ncbi:putative NADH dehydrogenase (quinone) [Helianthus annuus]|nr:putative NADH dehydrogenase (quinone) [Helianthus annuus]
MFPMVTEFMNYGQQTVRAARYIGQGFMITLSHANRLPIYPLLIGKLETDIRKKRLLNYSIDFGICIFCGNCVEYCPTNCLSMTEEYELSTYDRHELNYNQICFGSVTNVNN